MTSLKQQPPSEAVIHQLIAVRAYQLWEDHGQPRCCDVINWHQAEQEVMAMLSEAAMPGDGNRKRTSQA